MNLKLLPLEKIQSIGLDDLPEGTFWFLLQEKDTDIAPEDPVPRGFIMEMAKRHTTKPDEAEWLLTVFNIETSRGFFFSWDNEKNCGAWDEMRPAGW